MTQSLYNFSSFLSSQKRSGDTRQLHITKQLLKSYAKRHTEAIFMSHVRILHGTRPRHRKVIRSLRSNCAHSLGKIHVFHLPTANFTDYSFSTRDSTEESKQTRSLALFLCTESTYSAITSLMNYGRAWHYSRTDFFSILQHSY